MASFALRSQRTGSYKEFTLLEILKVIGDAVNDEIWLEDGEDVYNLSSFREIGGGGSGGNTNPVINWQVEEFLVYQGQDTFYLKYQPASALLFLQLNGIEIKPLKDYTLNEKELKTAFPLTNKDSLSILYTYQ